MRYLYLHGFASGPYSTKGVVFQRHFARLGIAIERLNLRVPSFEHQRLSAMIGLVRGRLADETVLIGSSLGGLTAALAAEQEPRVKAVVLLAPAFQAAARWRETLGPAWDDWARTGWREVMDYGRWAPARVDFGFVEEAARLERDFPDVPCRALVVHGRNDDLVPIDVSREFVRRHPHARLVELDDGHELTDSLPTVLAEAERFFGVSSPR